MKVVILSHNCSQSLDLKKKKKASQKVYTKTHLDLYRVKLYESSAQTSVSLAAAEHTVWSFSLIMSLVIRVAGKSR